MGIFQRQRQILPEPVPLECLLRHQGGKSKDNRTFRVTGKTESSVIIRTGCGQVAIVAQISAAFLHLYRTAAQAFSPGRHKRRRQPNGRVRSGHEVKTVFLLRLYRHAEIPDIVYLAARLKGDLQCCLPVMIERPFRQNPEGSPPGIPSRHFCGRHQIRPLVHALPMIESAGPPVFRDKNPLFRIRAAALRKQRILKCPVADHLRIQASVGGVVNVLEEQAV